MASKWQGGDLFIWVKRGCNNARAGGTGSGEGRKKYGDAGTKRFRFNPNPTRYKIAAICTIQQKSQADKKRAMTAPRVIKKIPSGFKKG